MKLLIGIALMVGYLLAAQMEGKYNGNGRPFNIFKRRFDQLPFQAS